MTRPRGSLNARTASLMRALTLADTGEGLIERLSIVAEDDDLPLRMRLDAVRYLAGALMGRVRMSYKTKRELAKSFSLQTPEDEQCSEY